MPAAMFEALYAWRAALNNTANSNAML